MSTALPRTRSHLVERAVEALRADGRDGGILPEPVPAPAPAETPAPAAPNHLVDRATLAQAGLAAASLRFSRTRTVEEIRVAQQQILRAVKAAKPEDGRCGRLVLITSARPAEGKTFCSLNIAGSIAASGPMPVILVDADAKPGSLTDLLGCKELPGLRQLASDPSRHPLALVVPTEVPLLSVLPVGRASDPGEEMPSGAMLAAALLRLGEAARQAILIVDSPPCLSTSDPNALSTVAGQVVMVVKAESTRAAELEASLDLVESCPTIQLLLNFVRMNGSDSFGAYGYYGYGQQAGAD